MWGWIPIPPPFSLSISTLWILWDYQTTSTLFCLLSLSLAYALYVCLLKDRGTETINLFRFCLCSTTSSRFWNTNGWIDSSTSPIFIQFAFFFFHPHSHLCFGIHWHCICLINAYHYTYNFYQCAWKSHWWNPNLAPPLKWICHGWMIIQNLDSVG